ncbi:LLM class flavin-dependent oxidoreductase [Nakamurella endophytica]|uniref:LLM class F420-dependent oxidoreductase n=1 Tax=Nakamurella endophytica TaxID=1748367 RepID=A0A917WKE7_9ACTN|nr:LLM class flavin-dependent oxidoreductase [Nakamurella endophytica]GGM10435.1 LLM class F420-dependent oxidoreductase [Nakamurella endophytica]
MTPLTPHTSPRPRRPEVWIHGFPSPGRTAAAAASVEEQGFDGMLLADSQHLVADPYVELALSARTTSRLGLGTGTTNPATRHPAVTAAAIATVHAESGGRAVLGIGRGDSALVQAGLPATTTGELERYLTDVRALLRGEPPPSGSGAAIGWIAGLGLSPVPVEVAATGPRTVAVGAVRADGVLLTVGADTARIAAAVAAARAARTAAGLDPAGLRLGAYVNVACHPDVATACDLVRGSTAIFAHFSSMSAGAGRDVAAADRRVIEQVGAGYDTARHGLGGSRQTAVLDDDFVARFAVVGPPERCLERLGALLDLGLDRIVVVAGSRDANPALVARTTELFAREVLPELHGLRG